MTRIRTILTVRSFPKACRVLREQGIRLPRRDRHGLHWSPPTEHSLLEMAKNRNYTGDYVYGCLRIDPRLGRRPGGKLRMRRASDDELHAIVDHHPGYITLKQFEEIQKIIEINRPSQERRNMGCGTALLEGKLVRCARHGNQSLRVSYQVDRRGRPRWCYYVCSGESLTGGEGCGSIPAATLEPVIVQAVLDRISTPRLTEIRRAWDEARATKEMSSTGNRQNWIEHARK